MSNAAKAYPPVVCAKHSTPVFLVDQLLDSGEIVAACPRCMPLVEVDVVRALYKSAMKGAVR